MPEVLSDVAENILRKRYYKKDENGNVIENWPALCKRVADAVAAKNPDKEYWSKKYYDLMYNLDYLPNSPALKHLGATNGCASACFVLGMEDSRESIFSTLKDAVAIESAGGGIGIDFSVLRPKNSDVIGTGGKSSGPVSFMSVYDLTVGKVIKQGGLRAGAQMSVFRVDHPDIHDFIKCKRDDEYALTNFNVSVAITDEFMEAVKNDSNFDLKFGNKVYETIKARKLFEEICEGAWHFGEPGVIFIDTVNNNNSYPEPIKSSNPCLSANSFIYTKNGIRSIEGLWASGEAVSVVVDSRFGEEEIQEATRPVPTGVKRVFCLKTVEGYELKLTANHRLMTDRGWVAVEDLREDDKIHLLDHKGEFGTRGSRDIGLCLGWLVGDGNISPDRAVLRFYGAKKELAEQFSKSINNIVPDGKGCRQKYAVGIVDIKGQDEVRVSSSRFKEIVEQYGIVREYKHLVSDAIYAGSEELQRGFLQALFTADGCVTGTKKNGRTVRLSSSYIELLVGVQRLLLNFGIASRIYPNRRGAGLHKLPDGRGSYKDYMCKANHELIISKDNMWRFSDEINFLDDIKRERLDDHLMSYKRGPDKEKFVVRFLEAIDEGLEVVYNLTVPVTHSYIANGFVVSNCSEQFLPPNVSCNLGSIDLSKHVKDGGIDWDKLKKTTIMATRFLDSVISVNSYPTPETKSAALKYRPIGLGQMGIADLFVLLGIKYGSKESQYLLELITSFIRYWSEVTSRTINQELIENISLKDQANTESKVFCSSYKRLYSEELGPYLERYEYPLKIEDWEDEKNLQQKYGRRNQTLDTIAPTGTLSLLAGCSSGIEPVFSKEFTRKDGTGEYVIKHPLANYPAFVEAKDILPDQHLELQAAAQRFIGNAISKTISLPYEATIDDVKHVYMKAHKLGLKSVTIYRMGSREKEVINIEEQRNKKLQSTQTSPDVKSNIIDKEDLEMEDEFEEEELPKLRIIREEDLIQRPIAVTGSTEKVSPTCGSIYATVNYHDGYPIETILNMSKSGNCLSSFIEAIGRLISLCLQAGIDPGLVVKQIRGIRCPLPKFDKGVVLESCSDAISKALERSLKNEYGLLDDVFEEEYKEIARDQDMKKAVDKDELKPGGDGYYERAKALDKTIAGIDPPIIKKNGKFIYSEVKGDTRGFSPQCPECGSMLTPSEGCFTCHSCGYSRCS